MAKTMEMPKLASMKRTPEDIRQDQGESPSIEAIAPDYPYGLCIHMDRDEMDKLGMTDMPKVGTELTLCAKVKVTRVSQSAVEGADEEASIDMQITDLGVV